MRSEYIYITYQVPGTYTDKNPHPRLKVLIMCLPNRQGQDLLSYDPKTGKEGLALS